MVLLVAAVLVILIAGVVVYPFLVRRPSGPPENLSDGTGPDTAEVGEVMDAIRTLQLEYQLGKLPDEVYQEQLRAYRLQAASILRRQAEGQTGDPEH